MENIIHEPQQRIILPEINKSVLAARGKDYSIKAFYAAMRLTKESGNEIIDIGSSVVVDPLEIPHTHDVIERAHAESLRRGDYIEYASSYGTSELRTAIARYFKRWGNIDIDPNPEVMVTRGIIDSYDRVLQSLDITHVIIPSWAPYYARSHATINGKEILEVPIDIETGNLDLSTLEKRLQEKGVLPGKALLYITHPSAPLGTVMEDQFIEGELIPYLRGKGIVLFSDSYIEYTRFDGKAPLKPILSYTGAKDIAVEAVTVSKELGLPGARAGGIAGNREIINAVRILAATKVDIVPGYSQILAAKALDEIKASTAGDRIKQELEQEILPRFEAMGWPVIKPAAGIDMLILVPKHFVRDAHVQDCSVVGPRDAQLAPTRSLQGLVEADVHASRWWGDAADRKCVGAPIQLKGAGTDMGRRHGPCDLDTVVGCAPQQDR